MLSRFDLYELAVQSPLTQAKFLRALHRAEPAMLREDFCGPASIARAWTALPSAVELRACGVDRDPEPLEHARRRAAQSGTPTSKRITFEQCDVRASRTKADIIAAFNFAACELTERATLLEYLRHARSTLNPGGLLACDLYGGANAFSVGSSATTIETPEGPVRYVWHQRRADPITARVENAMHFRLPDGTKMRSAFVYHWRLWSVPELRDAMRDAGFASTEVHLTYGQAMDDSGEIIATPHTDDDEIDDDFIAYVIGRID